jgi:adenylate kinase family enzyme
MRRRIAIIGCAGTGKTTLSKELERRLRIPATHLDRLYWKPGWGGTEKTVWERQVRDLCENDSWILDGNFGSTMDISLRKADTVVYLDMPAALCLYRVLKRWVMNRGRTRPDMGEGCPEKVDLPFLGWILTFRKRRRPDILKKLGELPPRPRSSSSEAGNR